jgi:tetratricopeptide (TPR) repeat protein
MRKSYLAILIAVASLGLIVLFLVLPKQPQSKVDEAMSSSDDEKIAKAIELVNGPQPMQGIQMLLQLVETNPNNVDAHYVLGEFAVRSGQYEKALDRFNKVIALDPKLIDAWIYKGEIYMNLDSAAQALNVFKQVIAMDSLNDLALVYAGRLNEQSGNLREAKQFYEQILRHNEDPVVNDSVGKYIRNIDIKLNNK